MQIQEEEKVIKRNGQNTKYFYMTTVNLGKINSKTSSGVRILGF